MAKKRFPITDSDALEIVKSRTKLEGGANRRRPFERTALKNRLFFLGRQWLIEDRNTGLFREPRSSNPNRVYYRANLIIGNVLRSVLTVSEANGEFVVPPTKNTRVAEEAAWVSTRLFEHLSRSCKMDELDELACLMAAIDGSCLWKIHWDPERGETSRFYYHQGDRKTVVVDPDDRTRLEMEEKGHYEDYALGEVRADIIPLFQTFWDWKARDRGVQDADWITQVDLVPRGTMRDEYGEKVDDLPPSSSTESATYWNELTSFMSGQLGNATLADDGPTSVRDDDMLLRVEHWERPGPSNGRMGRYIVTSGDTVLVNRENKYRVTKHPLPFVRQNWITCPGRFWGISLLEQLTGPQRQYNFARSKIIQHLSAHGAPMTFIPTEWNVPPHYVTHEPGAIIRYEASKGGEIKHGPTPQLPKEVLDSANQSRNEIAEISSQQSLDSSKLPGQIRSADGLNVALEERNKMLLHPAKNFMLAKEDVGQHQLDLAAHFYPDERVLQYVGDDQKWRVRQFRRADISSDLRVMLVKGELLTSPAAMRARVQEMVATGALNPMDPEDKEAILRAMEFRTAGHLTTERLVERENQEREVSEMIADPEKWMAPRVDHMAPVESWQPNPQTGEPEPPTVRGYPTNLYDLDETHSRELKRFMRTAEYRELDETRQSLLLLHLQEHESKIQAQAMQQIAMQQALQGTPGESGEPSRPRARQPAATP